MFQDSEILLRAARVGGRRQDDPGQPSRCAVVTALIFAWVAIVHGWRIFKGWTVQIGPHSVSITVSWIGLVVSALLAIWGFSLRA